MPERIFILSPAHCGGKRASYVYRDTATFELARRLRTPAGATLGETFAFLSGLYFRGKRAYAAAFATPPDGVRGTWVITSDRGVQPEDLPITIEDLRAMGRVDVDLDEPRYRGPLEASAMELARRSGDAEIVLLGSVATGKYVEVLTAVFGERLKYPREFGSLGDMARGGLMLRCVREGRELEYVPLTGRVSKAVRKAGRGFTP
jgi:hypothetical protein